jgi:Major capsid protein GP7
MAALSVTNPTLLDLAKRTDPDGRIAAIVELLNQTNEILDDMTWVEGNLPTGHRTTVRTGIPAPTWRQLYGGVQPTKSTTAQITDNTGMLEAYAEVDKALADLNGNTAAFRLSESRAFIEGMNEEVASTIFYGNEGSAPAEFTGLTARFNSTTAQNADNIIVGGSLSGQTDNASIWLVVWGPETCHGIVPKGSQAGLQMKDLGEVTIENVDGSGGRMQAYRTHFRWDVGLTVRDWRYIVRIPNIDKSLLTVDVSTGADLPDLMFQAMELIPNLAMGRPAFYMSRTLRTMFRRQLANKVKSSTLTFADVGGRRTMFFQEIPIRRCDALAADETRYGGA